MTRVAFVRPSPAARHPFAAAAASAAAAAAVLGLLALPAAAQDRVAGFAPMLNATATSPSAPPVRLNGTVPPLLGGPLVVDLLAPGYSFGVLAVAPTAHSGVTLPWNGGRLDFYLPPSGMSVLPLPLAGGGGRLQLPIPPLPALAGLDLAWQAVVASPTAVASSNLLLANLGTQPGNGVMQFAITFEKTIPKGAYLTDGTGAKMAIYCNHTGNETHVTITGTKSAGVGPFEIRDASGRTLGTPVPAGADIVNVTVRVNPNNCIYLFNADADRPMAVKWEVSVAVR